MPPHLYYPDFWDPYQERVEEWNKEVADVSPVPIVVGLALVYYEDVHLICAAKMRNIIDLLRTDTLIDLDNNGLMLRPE